MESMCPICLNEINKDQKCITNCKHDFCYNCLHGWLKFNINCPMCREGIESFIYQNELNRLFIINNPGDIENLNINIEEVRSMLVNVDNYNIKIKKLTRLNKILVGSLFISLITSISLGIHCEEFRF